MLSLLLYSAPHLASAVRSHLLAHPHEWLETSKIVRNGGVGAFVCAAAGAIIGASMKEENERFEGATTGAFLGVIAGGLLGVFAFGPTVE
jgi:hypothetical protein